MEEELILKTTNLTKSFGDRVAVSNINLNIYKGDIYGFLGPNGAGKSTTLRMILTLIKPTSGTIEIFGKDLNQNRREILSKIGSIVEKPDFYKYLSAERNIEIFGQYSGFNFSKSKIYEVLEFVGLKGREKSIVKTYSHGMKQRLGLAQALIHNPDLIILDEPTTGLDPQGIIELRNLILHLKNEGKTIFLSSHILSEIELIATRMVIIDQGKTIAEGKMDDLLNKNDLKVTFSLYHPDMNQVQSLIAESAFNSHFESYKGNQFIFKASELETALINSFFVEHQIQVIGIDSRTKLEDLFLDLTHYHPLNNN
jgi:ABC-type multidrug transport system ATPase subunit